LPFDADLSAAFLPLEVAFVDDFLDLPCTLTLDPAPCLFFFIAAKLQPAP
jgi:hypothetical protein